MNRRGRFAASESPPAVNTPAGGTRLRLLVGIDLALRGSHRAAVVDERGTVVLPERRLRTDVRDLDALREELWQRFPGAEVQVIVEPTGTVWIPIARHGLRRGVKQEAKLARLVAELKQSIRAKVARAVPGLGALVGDPASRVARLLDGRHLDPRRGLAMGPEAFGEVLAAARRGPVPEAWRCRLWACYEAAAACWDPGDLEAQDLPEAVAEDSAILDTLLAPLGQIRRRNLALDRALDPEGHGPSLPGVGAVLAPALLAGLPDPHRIPGSKVFRAYAGRIPRVEQSGVRRAKGTRSTKAGPAWLRRALDLAANVARRQDPELARVYPRCVVEKGHHPTQAVCVVAVHLAGRLDAVRRDGKPYVLRDERGTAVDRETARRLARSCCPVPETVRLSRRNREVPSSEIAAPRPYCLMVLLRGCSTPAGASRSPSGTWAGGWAGTTPGGLIRAGSTWADHRSRWFVHSSSGRNRR